MKKSLLVLLLLVGILSIAIKKVSATNYPEEKKREWYLPRDAKIQYAGNIGFLSFGITYYLVDDWYRLSLMYGNTSMHSRVRTLNTVAFKNTFILKKFHVGNFDVSPTLGVSINFGSTHNTYRNLPEYFPNDYYYQNKIHVAPFYGLIIYHPIKSNVIKGIDFYTEIGTMDNYILEQIRTKKVGIEDIWNIALGISIYLR